MNKLKTIFAYTLGGVVLLGVVALAERSLTPLDGSSTSTGTMYTLSDVYNKIQDFDFSPDPHNTSTTSLPAVSMNSISEIYTSLVNLNLSSTTIATGTTIMGITGNITLPAINKVQEGVVFGPGNSLTGTLPAALEWSSDQGLKTWSAAVAACTNMGSTWRLPKLGELKAAMSNSFLDDGSILPGGLAEYTYYWSSTEFDSGLALCGEFGSGYYVGHIDIGKVNEISFRCVR
jgi:hypothetical protein